MLNGNNLFGHSKVLIMHYEFRGGRALNFRVRKCRIRVEDIARRATLPPLIRLFLVCG